MKQYRHVVITGASAGIGEALVREFSAAGAAVTMVARRRPLMEAIAAELENPVHIVTADLSDPATSASWLEAAEVALGPVDVLINNAGVQVIAPTAHVDVERGERSLAINLLAPLRLMQAVLPGMIERERGTIINIASMAALAPTPSMTYYNAGKGGLAAASEALRGEQRGSGVNVVTVYPGIIETNMAKEGLAAYQSTKMMAMQPRGTTTVLARKVRRATDRRRARVIYPGLNKFARWFPGTTRWLTDRYTPAVAIGAAS